MRTLSFSYLADGSLASASDPAAIYSYGYDGLGRVTNEGQTLDGLTPQMIYAGQFDVGSRRTELLAEVGGDEDFLNTYTYDNLSRMTRLEQASGADNVVAEKRIDFAYSAASQFDQITRYADLAGDEFVANTFYSYDGLGRLTKLLHTEDASAPGSGWGTDPLAGYEFTYDAGSRITSIDSYVDGLTEFDYDNTDQLTGADHTGQTDESYSYDENGNRTMSGHSVGTNNRLLSDGVYSYTYDDEGNRLTKTKISTSEKEEYTWDHRDRLSKVTFKSGGGTVTKTVDFVYDAFDRLIRRTVDPDGATGSASLVDTFFSWEANQINLQFNGNALSHRLLYGPAVDQIMADESVSSLAAAGDVLWTLADHLGTPRDLASYDDSLDETTVENHRVFNSFGNLTSETNGSFTTLVGFTGAIFEATTGLNYHRARWLDLATGRWISEDPVGFAAADSNLMRYVENRPTNAIDPTGLAPKTTWFKGIMVLVEKETAEFVLENGRRIKIRNAKFIDSCVSLKDLERLTEVSQDTINALRKKYGEISITFDKFGQPDFTKYMEGFVRIQNPTASNYADLAWAQLLKDKPGLYTKLYSQKQKYVWHHAADGSLQLIDKDLHAAYQHTGLQSIMKGLASLGIVFLIPGADSFEKGELGDGCRDTIWGWLPPTWISDFSFSVFDVPWTWGQETLNGEEGARMRKQFRDRYLP